MDRDPKPYWREAEIAALRALNVARLALGKEVIIIEGIDEK